MESVKPIQKLEPEELVRISAGSASLRAKSTSGFPLANLLGIALLMTYSVLLFSNISQFWFNPNWTTDDALQQVFPFHQVLNPGIFENDIITRGMEAYLAPLHYWISSSITWLCGDPILMSHWVMCIQVVLSLGFLFLAVKKKASLAAACFAVTWLLHTRHFMQRLNGGLPRGWAAPLICAYIYFLFSGRHRAILLVILAGCLLNPTPTVVIALSYGMVLTLRLLLRQSRNDTIRPFLEFLLAAPMFILLTWTLLQKPADIGRMVSYEEASQMPEFQRPRGRFAVLPLKDPFAEIAQYAFRPFKATGYTPPKWWKAVLPLVVIGLLLVVSLLGAVRKRASIPVELWALLLASLATYFASRLLLFRLYLPDRHLQIPPGLFLISALSIAVWSVLHKESSSKVSNGKLSSSWPSTLGLTVLAGIIIYGSGSGLLGSMNYNRSPQNDGHLWAWIKKNTETKSFFAGEPSHIDPMQLFGMRRAYITSETAHPFYTSYYVEAKRRLIITLRAHYSARLVDFVRLLKPEGVDYFVFSRKKFKGQGPSSESYSPTFSPLLEEVLSAGAGKFAYRELVSRRDLMQPPVVPFYDEKSIVVNLKALELALSKQ